MDKLSILQAQLIRSYEEKVCPCIYEQYLRHIHNKCNPCEVYYDDDDTKKEEPAEIQKITHQIHVSQEACSDVAVLTTVLFSGCLEYSVRAADRKRRRKQEACFRSGNHGRKDGPTGGEDNSDEPSLGRNQDTSRWTAKIGNTQK